ncbi:MAG: nucleotidyltransferase family protein [Deltaproteobacteria bacterium]|nr:nucleotidyltransferase family protein [Deltaproteobacteria bacterium]
MIYNPQYIVLFHHFRRFLELAAKEKIEAIPLKGTHLLTSVYPPDQDRGVMSDVDFLVRPEHFERAGELLRKLGFNRLERTSLEIPEFEEAYILQIDETRRIMFEVHRYIFEPIRFPIDHEALWARSAPSHFDGAPCRRLASEDHFVHIAFHAAVHRLIPLERSLMDLELLIRNGDIDLETVVARAQEWKVTRSVWLFIDLLRGQAPDLDLDSWSDRLAPPIPVRVALRMLVPDGKVTRLTNIHHRLQAAVIWPVIFESPIQVLRFVATHPLARRLAWKMKNGLKGKISLRG